MREDIKSMTLEELTAALGQMGEPDRKSVV